MKRLLLTPILILLTGLQALADDDADPGPTRPNIIFVLADDLGYGDVGVTFQNGCGPAKAHFATPHLDALAARGMILRQHYSASPVSASSRASLLLGQHQGDCPIRDNQFEKPIPHNHTLATVLKAAGYHTVAIGEWGLPGAAPDYPGHPLRHGFDEFFGFLAQASAHAYYADPNHPLHDGLADVTNEYLNIYSTDLFTARAKKFLVDHQATHPQQPFFIYLAYPAPHFPQGLPGNALPAGAGLQGGVQWPPTPTPDTRDRWLQPEYRDATYEPSPTGPPVPWSARMKRYATVVGRLDDGVGDIEQTLRDLHLDRSTLVVFTSANGPGADGIDPRDFDSAGPFDGYKRDCWEGGIRVPTIVSWPGHIPAGLRNDFVCSFCDWMPTLADVARLIPPAQADGVSLKPTLLELPGQRDRGFVYTEHFCVTPAHPTGSLADLLARKHTTGRGQQQMIRVGDYVGLRVQIEKADDPLRLYDVITDPHEDHDVAGDASFAAVLQQMRLTLATVRRPDPASPRPYDDVPLPGIVSAGEEGFIEADRFPGDWPWVPDLGALAPTRSSHVHGFDVAVCGAADEPFAVRFTGSIVVPTTGTYTFWLTTETGAELWLHDAHVIDDDFNHTGATVAAQINLAAGAHPFRLFYRHKLGSPTLQLEYAGPSIARQPVPTSELRMPGRGE